MSAIVLDAYADPESPDARLATYITNQMVVEPESIPEPIWGLLGGFVTLTNLLLGRVEEASDGTLTKQDLLDSYAYAARQNPEE